MRTVTARPRLGPHAPRGDASLVDAAAIAVAEPDAGIGTVPKREALLVFCGFGLLYLLVGLWVVGQLNVVNVTGLERLAHASMAWYGDPPKLAAVGFETAPVGTLLLAPFALISGLVTSAVALPLAAAPCAAGALVFVDRTLALGSVERGPRLLLVALVGLNPMFAYYATNGSGDAAALLFAAIGLFCLIRWGSRDSPRYLVGAGLAFAIGALTSYELIFWGILAAFVVSGVLTTAGRNRSEVEGSVIAFLAPLMYALGTWILLNAVILGDPFAWISRGDGAVAINALAGPRPPFELGTAFADALSAQLIFPVALAALPLLLLYARDAIGLGLASLVVAGVAYPIVAAAVAGYADAVELRSALPAVVAGVAGIAWVHLRAPEHRRFIRAVAVVGAVAALPLAWTQMNSFPNQDLEQAFARAISSGDDQEGRASEGGLQAGIAPEREMADFIAARDIGAGRILTDESRTFGVIALTGTPELFLDRAAVGADEWDEIAAAPGEAADYALVARTGGDGILAAYPGADEGSSEAFAPVVANDRYALLQVVDPAAGG